MFDFSNFTASVRPKGSKFAHTVLDQDGNEWSTRTSNRQYGYLLVVDYGPRQWREGYTPTPEQERTAQYASYYSAKPKPLGARHERGPVVACIQFNEAEATPAPATNQAAADGAAQGQAPRKETNMASTMLTNSTARKAKARKTGKCQRCGAKTQGRSVHIDYDKGKVVKSQSGKAREGYAFYCDDCADRKVTRLEWKLARRNGGSSSRSSKRTSTRKASAKKAPAKKASGSSSSRKRGSTSKASTAKKATTKAAPKRVKKGTTAKGKAAKASSAADPF